MARFVQKTISPSIGMEPWSTSTLGNLFLPSQANGQYACQYTTNKYDQINSQRGDDHDDGKLPLRPATRATSSVTVASTSGFSMWANTSISRAPVGFTSHRSPPHPPPTIPELVLVNLGYAYGTGTANSSGGGGARMVGARDRGADITTPSSMPTATETDTYKGSRSGRVIKTVYIPMARSPKRC